MAGKEKYIGTGKRKRSVARVALIDTGKGDITINGLNINDYIPRESLITVIRQPLVAIDKDTGYDISVNVSGGGLTGQVGALVHGISKALLQFDENLKPTLKKEKLTTRDSRAVERKKYGHRKARRSFQFSKR